MISLAFVPPLEEPDKHVWATLGDAPDVGFPTFDTNGRAKLLADIKAALKKKLKDSGGNLDLTKSGATPRDEGLVLEPKFNQKLKGNQLKKEKKINDAKEIDAAFTPDLMQEYFNQAAETAEKKFKAVPRGIPHDYRTDTGEWTGPQFTPNAWLPGVFVIDEIFKALLSTVDKMIEEANEERDALKKNAPPANPGAQQKLTAFIDAFSRFPNGPTGNGDADQFRAFINYYPFDPNEPGMQTYVKLVEVDGLIVAAIVHVGDWAAGYHSSGSAIHY